MRKSKMLLMVSIYHWYFVEESYDVMFSRKEVSHGQFDSFKANDGISKPHKSN